MALTSQENCRPQLLGFFKPNKHYLQPSAPTLTLLLTAPYTKSSVTTK